MPPGSSSGTIRIDLAVLQSLYAALKEDHGHTSVRVDQVIARLNDIDRILSKVEGAATLVKWCAPLATAAIIAFVAHYWNWKL